MSPNALNYQISGPIILDNRFRFELRACLHFCRIPSFLSRRNALFQRKRQVFCDRVRSSGVCGATWHGRRRDGRSGRRCQSDELRRWHWTQIFAFFPDEAAGSNMSERDNGASSQVVAETQSQKPVTREWKTEREATKDTGQTTMTQTVRYIPDLAFAYLLDHYLLLSHSTVLFLFHLLPSRQRILLTWLS